MAPSPLTKVIHVIEEFRRIDPELPTQIALILLLIARKPGISLKELTQLSGLSKAAVSRNVALLSKEHGRGLVTYFEDPMDRRNKVAKLTPDGERFIRALTRHLEAEAA